MDPNGQDFSVSWAGFEGTTPWLAESWEQTDPLTYVF